MGDRPRVFRRAEGGVRQAALSAQGRGYLAKTIHGFAANLEHTLHGSAGFLVRKVMLEAVAEHETRGCNSARANRGEILCWQPLSTRSTVKRPGLAGRT